MIHPAIWYPFNSAGLISDRVQLNQGNGVTLIDKIGNEYLDCSSGLWNVIFGYSCRPLLRAMEEQMRLLPYASIYPGYTHEPAETLGRDLLNFFKALDFTNVVYGNSGSDAVETAIKLARLYWHQLGLAKKKTILSFAKSFHGVHLGLCASNGSPSWREGLGESLPGFSIINFVKPNGAGGHSGSFSYADQLEQAIMSIGSRTIAGVLIDAVNAAAGVHILSSDELARIDSLCKKHDLLLIVDEVVSGFGRVGSTSASQLWGLKPDMIALSKGLTGGYFPMGATMCGRTMMERWRASDAKRPLMHGYTTAGHPIGCSVALSVLQQLQKKELLLHVSALEAKLRATLPRLRHHDLVGEVRGTGLLWAIDLVAHKDSSEPLSMGSPVRARLLERMKANGVLARTIGNSIVMAPALVTTLVEAQWMVDRVGSAINEATT